MPTFLKDFSFLFSIKSHYACVYWGEMKRDYFLDYGLDYEKIIS